MRTTEQLHCKDASFNIFAHARLQVILGMAAALLICLESPLYSADPPKASPAKQVEKTNVVQDVKAPAPLKSTEFFSQSEKKKDCLNASIEGAPLKTVLRQLATVTGWKVFMEPGLTRTVSAKFKDLPSHESLPLLFGSLNYALVSDGTHGQRLLVFQKDQKDATEFIRPDLSQPIPNELVVVLKKGSKLTPQEIAQLIGGKVGAVSKDGMAIRFIFEDEEGVARAKEILAKLMESDVDSLQNNYYMISPETAKAFVSQGLAIPRKVTAVSGEKTTIALIDSAPHLDGINYSDVLLTPVDFTGEYTKSYNLSTGPTHVDSMLGSSLFWLQNSGYDALDFNYLPLIAIGSEGYGDAFSVAEAVNYANAAGVDVINISLSGDGYSPYLNDAIQGALANGRTIAAAAGNEPTGQITYPAGYKGVVGVTALERGQIAPYANYGNFVDAATAGTGLFYFDDSWYLTTGTSVSTIYFSTLVAAEMAATGKSAAEAQSSVLKKFGYKP
ncbi:MAG: S8 family serine peptidase [Verrucomicrobia bacterium]|nr:S8 family serine peptidase [Verrucomicrobiota bacterium]